MKKSYTFQGNDDGLVQGLQWLEPIHESRSSQRSKKTPVVQGELESIQQQAISEPAKERTVEPTSCRLRCLSKKWTTGGGKLTSSPRIIS